MTVERDETPQYIETNFDENPQGLGQTLQPRVKTNKPDSKARQGCYERFPVQTEAQTS